MIRTSTRLAYAHSGKTHLTCAATKRWLPGYLDGALPEANKLHERIARHLDVCVNCRAELEQYRSLSRAMLTVRQAGPPQDLAVSIRVAVSKDRKSRSFGAWVNHCRDRLDLIVDHVLQPLAIPATGGALVALIVFGFVFPILGAGLHFPGARPDLPLNFTQPARLQTLAGFPIPGVDDIPTAQESQGVLVETTVNSEGQAVDYRIIGSPVDPGTQRQLDRVMLFSRFRPQMNFGRPTSGGRVVLGFSRVLVRG
jgi:hypothetical protein